MSAVAGDSPYTVTVDEENVEVAVDATGVTDATLELSGVLSGSTLRVVRDHALTDSPLKLAEDKVQVDALQFRLAAGEAAEEGELAWNANDKTLDLGLGVPTLQIGQEFMVRVLNNSGSTIANGAVITLSGASGSRPTAALADATVRQSSRATLGIATEAIANGNEGMVTVKGLVRGVNTAAFVAGWPLFLHASTPGAMQGPTSPPPPTSVVFLGVCLYQHATAGVMLVTLVTSPTLTELVDVDVSSPQTTDLLVYNAVANTFENKIPSMTTKLTLPMYVDKATRGKKISQFGGMEKIIDAGAVSTGSPQAGTNGCGKLLFVVNAGSDMVGDITITGDTVDRNTGAITSSDTEVVTLSGVTTDTSDTDAAGNVRHGLEHAYVTSKWFQGAFSVSTTETNVSDFDVWNVAFHQFGDTPTGVELDTIDFTAIATNTTAWLYAYIYSVEQTNGTCDITREGSIELPASGIVAADLNHRRKIGGIAKALDPSQDGIWFEIHPGPFNQTYWENLSTAIIYQATAPLTLS